MTISEKNTTVTVAIDKETKELLEKYAHECDMTRSKLARNLIYVALDDFNLLKGIGLIKIAVTFRDIFESIENRLKKDCKENPHDKLDNDTMSVIMDTEIKKMLEKYADEIGLPLKIFCRNLVYVGLDHFKLLRNVGIIRLAVSFRRFMESFEDFDVEETQKQF